MFASVPFFCDIFYDIVKKSLLGLEETDADESVIISPCRFRDTAFFTKVNNPLCSGSPVLVLSLNPQFFEYLLHLG